MRLYNTVGSTLSLPKNFQVFPGAPVQNFNPLKYIPEEKKLFASKYAYANSLAEIEAINQQIDQEEKDRETMAASGWLGTVGVIGAGVVDPIMYAIPGLGAIKKYQGFKSVLANGLSHAAYGAGAMTLQSALLHQTQVTRTLGESATDVAGATFLSGLLGGVGGAWAAALEKNTKPLATLADQVEKELVVPDAGRYTSAEIQKIEAAHEHATSALEALKNSGVAQDTPEHVQTALKVKQTAATLEKMKGDVFHKDPLEPGYFEIPESALKADTEGNVFETSKGSVYSFSKDGSGFLKTARNKSLHQFHDATDVGLKPESQRTIFVKPEDIGDLQGALYARGWPKAPEFKINGNQLELKLYYGPGGKRIKNTIIPFVDQPEVGLHPLEFWADGNKHLGNQVVKIGHEVSSATELAVKTQLNGVSPERSGMSVTSNVKPLEAPAQTEGPVFKDYLEVESWASPQEKAPVSPKKLKSQQLDELTTLLGQMRNTATVDAGEMNLTEFFTKHDIPFEQAKKVGDGLGYRVKIPFGGWVNFPRGATLSQINDLGLDPRKLASMMSKGSPHEDVVASLREALGQVVDTSTNHSEAGYYSGITGDTSAIAKLDAEGAKQVANLQAAEVDQLKYINKRANEGLHAMAKANTAEEFAAAFEALDNADYNIMPEAFWNDVKEVMDAATARVEGKANERGSASGQHGSNASSVEPGASVPGKNEPASTSEGTDNPNDLPNDPLAFERGAPADWETVYSSEQLNLGKEELNIKNLDERLKDHALIEKLPLFNKQDPLIRTQLSKSIETRKTVQRLVETPLKYEKNALGIASELPAEALARQYKAPLAFSLKAMDDLFVEYRTGAAKLGGKAMAMAQDALGGVEGKMSFDEFKQAVGKAMRRGDVHEIPQVAKAAQAFRQQLFNPLKEKAIALGVLPPGVETDTAISYLTRVWDVEKIAAKRQEFFELNREWLLQKEMDKPFGEQRSDAQIDDIVDQVIDRIMGTPEGRLPYDILGEEVGQAEKSLGGGGKKGLSKPLKERVYDIPDDWAEDFLVNDAEHVAKVYERSMASDMALLERFGSVDLQAEIQAIRRDYAAKVQLAKTEQETRLLKKLMDNDIRDVAAMRDRIRGIYGLPADPGSTWVRTGKALRAANFLSLMGGVTISSLADVARPMMVHGLQRYLKDGLVPLVTNFKAFRASAQEVKLAGTALDMILESRAMGIGELMDDYGRGNKFERLLHGTAGLYGKATGLSQWTATLKQVSGMMTQSRMIQAVLDTKAGTITKKEMTNLAASYIDKDLALRIASEFEKYGDRNGTVMLPNTVYWTDREAVKAFRAGLAKEVDKIIVTPGVGDKPLWLSNEWGKLFGQFKSFFISATQRVLVSGLQDRDLGVLNGAVFATGLGVLTTLVQAKLSGRKLSMRPQDLILEGVDRAGLMGWLFELNGSVEKLTRGHYGLSSMMGKEPMSRFQSRNVTDSLLGPSAGRVEDFARATGSVTSGDWSKGDVRALRRLLPFQNLFYLRAVFDKAEDGLKGALHVEDNDTAKTE